MPSLQEACRFPNFNQQAYRYGIALSCIGVLLNWLGVAQAYLELVRYLGVSLVIVGSFLIITAMFRWMFFSPQHSTVQEVNSEGAGDLHVITVPMGRAVSQSRSPGPSTGSQGKPPDYFLVTEKPPSYEEAMSMLPPYPATCSGTLQLNTEGGLEDFLTPHQVPESQPEGAIGGNSHQTGMSSTAQEPLQCYYISSPPAYSSQVSLVSLCTYYPSVSGNDSPSSPQDGEDQECRNSNLPDGLGNETGDAPNIVDIEKSKDGDENIDNNLKNVDSKSLSENLEK